MSNAVEPLDRTVWADPAILHDVTTYQLAESLEAVADFPDAELAFRANEFLPELQALLRRLAKIGVRP